MGLFTLNHSGSQTLLSRCGAVPDSKTTLHYDAEVYSQLDRPWDSIVRFLYVTLADLGWYKGTDEEVVMDVGCGPGRLTSQFILPCFPNLKKLIALDAVPSMIEMAKSLYPHPKIEYVVANFEDDSAVEWWKQQVTKFISVHCFNRMKSQYDAFKRVYELLPPNGEAALFFLLHNGYYNAITKLAKDPKWQSYITVNFLFSVSELAPCIPDSKMADFKKDLFHYTFKENGMNTDGTPVDKTTTLELVVQK
ncbi:hypothetical protein AVEN_201813-1 [Araneus ventricosus]|uniref:Methyltransferase type 11 domain-containing protein n=1 Tax=Araneus ventricosus TaxID=182803 RepID=A0A4Y2MEG1_ARAVE|nr:hypothetical protein AVEN_201813-1 [Araneus ventricosus]